MSCELCADAGMQAEMAPMIKITEGMRRFDRDSLCMIIHFYKCNKIYVSAHDISSIFVEVMIM